FNANGFIDKCLFIIRLAIRLTALIASWIQKRSRKNVTKRAMKILGIEKGPPKRPFEEFERSLLSARGLPRQAAPFGDPGVFERRTNRSGRRLAEL
ncbi:MAG: hypothetical protein SPL30_09285, partial [Succinivibrio sp.]|nr:hypothetical protein [Succinivibrio sp.]